MQMKRKKLLKTAALLCSSLLVTACGAKGETILTGYCLVSGEQYLILPDNGSGAVVLSDATNKNLLANLQTGDKIAVTCNVIQTTYPGHTDIYSCAVLSHGSVEDMPQDELATLKEMGWYIPKETE